jgi:ADP-heptose:LPS heptosyltransferase
MIKIFLKDKIKIFLFKIAFYLTKKNNLKKKNKNIAIVFTNAIGDYIIFSSILPVLCEYYKNYKIYIIGYERWKDIAYKNNNIEYIFFDRDKIKFNIRYIYNLLNKINCQRYSLAINPVYSRNLLSDLIIYTLKADLKIAFEGDLNNISLKNFKWANKKVYNKLIKVEKKNLKEIDYYNELLYTLGVKLNTKVLPKIQYNKTASIKINLLLKEVGILKSDKFVVIMPGAQSSIRVWNIKNYIPICEFLIRHNYKIIITGGSKEKQISEELNKNCHNQLINLTGKLNLTELAELYRLAHLYIGNDTGALHIAIAVGLPTIAILGGGHPFRFYPYGPINKHKCCTKKLDCFGCNWKCIYDEARCIQEVTPSQVINEIISILNIN